MNINSRKRRRDLVGYKGKGTPGWTKTNSFGDYKSLEYNNKERDFILSMAKKNKTGFRKSRYTFGNINHAGMTKRYVDNHQKVTY